MRRPILLTLSLVLLAGLEPSDVPAAPTREQVDAVLSLPWNQLRTYAFDPSSPLDSRIRPCPKDLLRALREMDGNRAYIAYAPTAHDIELFRRYVTLLPPGIRRVLQTRLLRLCFVKNFMGSGFTSFVPGGDRGYVWMVLNSNLFQKSLSETLTIRESSPFKGKPSVRVEAGEGYRGLLYGLLHEGTHAVDYTEGITPYTGESIPVILHKEELFASSWDVWMSYSKPRQDADFPLRDKLRFFGLGGGPLLPARDAPALFRGLAASPFPSAYAARSWAEDAAELVTFFHLTQVLNLPYVVTVGDGPKALRLEPMSSSRVLKRAERIYQRVKT